jgi:hypothetical protein
MTGSYAGESLYLGFFAHVLLIDYVHTALLFTAVGIVQMGAWAVKKHKAYKKEFGSGYPRGRKAMIPFVL